MKIRLALIALLASGLAGCNNQPQDAGKANDYLSDAHLREKAELREAERGGQAPNVKWARLTIGEVAALRLEACYAGGFPTEGKTTYMSDGDVLEDYPKDMSNRKRAECQAVIDAVHKGQAKFDAKERKKDAAYDKAHPAK